MNLSHSLCSLAVAVAVFNAASCNRPEPIAREFARFEGRWIAQEQDGSYIEVWKTGTETIADGYAFSLKGTDSIFHEQLTLAATDSGIYYLVSVPGQNSGEQIGFKLTPPRSDNTLVFENPSHDFPSQLSYTFIGQDSLHVVVSGSGRSFELQFIRSK